MIHFLAKAAEVRGEEEIRVNTGDRADRVRPHRPRDAACAREVAAVLHDGVDAPCGFRTGDKIARVRERLGHRLLTENMAACGKPRRNNFMPGRRHDNVEEEVRATFGDERMNVAGDEGIFQREFGGARFGAFDVEVGQADNAQIRDPRGGLQPRPAHCATTDERGFQLHQRFSPGPPSSLRRAP